MILDFNSEEFKKSPMGLFAKLRRNEPVCEVTAPLEGWAISRYEDVEAIFKNPTQFSSCAMKEFEVRLSGIPELFEGQLLIAADPPEHSKLRRMVSKAFSLPALMGMKDILDGLCNDIIDDISNKDTIDYVQEVAMRVPVEGISTLLGVERSMYRTFKRWSDDMLCRTVMFIPDPVEKKKREAEIVQSYCEFRDTFSQIIEDRMQNPRQDLISSIIEGNKKDERLSTAEILNFTRLILVAGNESTSHLIGICMMELVKNPAMQQLLRDNVNLIPNFVDEVIRCNGPVVSILRRTTEAVDFRGKILPKGALIFLLIASANRDEQRFRASEEIILGRGGLEKDHLGFGSGIHFCLGSHLARMEAETILKKFLYTFDFEDARPTRERENDWEWIDSFTLRGLKSLPLKIHKRSI